MSGRVRVSQSSLYTARIKMNESVWRYIVNTKLGRERGRDQVQCKLDQLVRENPDARARILVTNDEDVVDQLRDWCARMLAAAVDMRRQGRDIEGATLTRDTNRVIAAIDNHDNKIIEANRIFNGRR